MRRCVVAQEDDGLMRKSKFSLAEGKNIWAIFVLIMIQVIVIFSFVLLWTSSRKIDIEDTKQAAVTVEDLFLIRAPGEDQLVVVADSTYYLFESRARSEERSVHELYDSISMGDRLALTYYVSGGILRKEVNRVIDARTETEIYRSFEAYNRGRQSVSVFVVILYAVIETVFVGIVFVYVWIHRDQMKSIRRKAK